MKRKKLLYNSFKYSFFEARFLYKDPDADPSAPDKAPAAAPSQDAEKLGVSKATKEDLAKIAATVERLKLKQEFKEIDEEIIKLAAEQDKPEEWLKEKIKKIEELKADIEFQGLDENMIKNAVIKQDNPEEWLREHILDQVFLATNIDKEKKAIDWWKINVNREELPEKQIVNADKWLPQTKEGLKFMFDEWEEKLEVPTTEPFYINIKKQLSKSSDTNFLNGSGNPSITKKQKKWYLNPPDHLNELLGFDPHFYRAWKFHESIKDFMTLQDVGQELTEERVKNLDKDSIAEKVTDGMKKNIVKFQDAIKNRDYATAGVYVLGAWAMWQAYKSLPAGKKSKVGNVLIWGSALYAANSFAKTAGYDIGKKLGIKDLNAEIKGTPLESLLGFNIPQAKKIDTSILLRSHNISMKDLYNEYQKSNSSGDPNRQRFIDPALFPAQFPKFQGKSPEVDYDINKDYKYTGKQLYLIIQCLEIAYDKTYKVSNKKEYHGKSLADVIQGGTAVSASNVREFLGSLRKPSIPKTTLFRPEQLKKANARFNKAFEGTGAGAWVDLTPLSKENPNAAGGRIMDYPVVIVADDQEGVKKYYVYSRLDYEENKGNMSEDDILGAIPFEGDASTAVSDIETIITEKVTQLLDPIITKGGRVSAAPQYYNGKWRCKYTMPKLDAVDIAQEESEAVFTFFDSGIVQLDVAKAGISINLGDLSPDFLHENYLLAKLVAKDEFNALRPFYNNRTLNFVDNSMVTNAAGDTEFKISLLGEEVLVTYNKTTETDPKKRKFEISVTDQKRLIDNPKFRREYAKARAESKDFTKVFKELENLIDIAPEEFHFHIFRGLGKWFTTGTMDRPFSGVSGDIISGSVKDYYGKSVLESKKTELIYSIAGRLSGPLDPSKTPFENISEIETKAVKSKLNYLQGIATTFNRKSIELGGNKEAWAEEDFMRETLDRIQMAGNSATYSGVYRDFEIAAVNFMSLGGSDLSKIPHNRLNNIKAAFSYYTAYLDRDSLDDAVYNPKPGVGTAKYEDLQRIAYLRYVKERVIKQAATFGVSNIPSPESSRWDILPFKTWQSVGNTEPLDPMDNLPALTHNPTHKNAAGNYEFSELDNELMNRIKDAKTWLLREYKGNLDPVKLDKLLNNKFTDNTSKLRKSKSVGYFKKYPKSLDQTTDINGDGVIDILDLPTNYKQDLTCKVWDKTDAIHSLGQGRRSLQEQAIESEVAKFIAMVMHKKSLWKKPPSLNAKIIQKFPSLAGYWPFRP